MSDDQFHHSDPLPKAMPDHGRELYRRFLAASDGMPADAQLSAAVNMIAHTIRECYGLRSAAEQRIGALFAKCMELTLRFYDPVTNRRRSTTPFTQRLVMPRYEDPTAFLNVAKGADKKPS